MGQLKAFVLRIGSMLLLGIVGGLSLAFITMLLAVGVTIVQQAQSMEEIPKVISQLEANAHMSLDLLQQLLEDMPFGRQCGYLFDGFLQKQIVNPFTLAGGQEIWIRSLITAAFVNLFSLLLAPQRLISSAAYSDAFQFVAAVMQLVCNALAIIVLTLLERLCSFGIWLGVGLAGAAFILEAVILYCTIRLLAFGRILLHVIKHDIIGFILKQTIFALFLCVLIYMLESNPFAGVWEYVLCMLFLIASVPIIDGIERLCK